MTSNRTSKIMFGLAAVAALLLVATPALAKHPIFNACRRGQVGRVKSILKRNPQAINLRWGEGQFTPLHVAARYGRVKVAALLIQKGANIEAKTGEGEAWTPLHYAAADGRTKMVAFLLQKGANIHARGVMYGNTPLHAAAQSGQVAVVKLLLAKGADKNARNRKGLTPADLARRNCQARTKAPCQAAVRVLGQ
ncbi:MAG: ankyrin repeat domain-containing protein [Proteobacteria bacterium]|nr:ankyrin repeat domain-containing protein [Pseudomonadota bacterium]MBU1742769.1 ankyrin repeat domain-containing protein [Pseudomonadota bacterium]